MVLSLVCLVLPLGAFATLSQDVVGVCNSPAACLAQQTSLLQRHVQSEQRTEVLDQEHHSTPKALAGFERYANELIAKDKAHNLTLSDSETMAIKTIIEFIDSMYPDLVAGHDEDILEVEQCNTQLKLCESNRLDVNLSARRDGAITRRSQHDTCRAQESIKNISTVQKCDDYKTYRQGNTSALLPDCAAVGLAPSHIKTNDPAAKKTMQDCLVKVKAWLDPLWKLYKDCKEGTSEVVNITNRCNSHQNKFEDDTCVYTTLHSSECSNYRVCWNNQVGECNKTCSRVAGSVLARKSDNATAVKVKCLLEVLTSANADKASVLNACHTVSIPESPWDITCPNRTDTWPAPRPHPPIPCHPELDRPCQRSWLYAEYENKSWYSTVNMSKCQNCRTDLVIN